MKKIVKRITAVILAAATAMALGLTASAGSNDGTFYNPDRKIKYKLTVSSVTIAGAVYQLTASVEGLNDPACVYANLWVKAVLNGNNTSNTVNETTFHNTSTGKVVVTRPVSDCRGAGYGEFECSGTKEYGNISGYVPVPKPA